MGHPLFDILSEPLFAHGLPLFYFFQFIMDYNLNASEHESVASSTSVTRDPPHSTRKRKHTKTPTSSKEPKLVSIAKKPGFTGFLQRMSQISGNDSLDCAQVDQMIAYLRGLDAVQITFKKEVLKEIYQNEEILAGNLLLGTMAEEAVREVIEKKKLAKNTAIEASYNI